VKADIENIGIMHLRDYEWWPKVWDSINSEEIVCLVRGLTLVVDYEEQPCNGLISSDYGHGLI
jgi:hypothetical protein